MAGILLILLIAAIVYFSKRRTRNKRAKNNRKKDIDIKFNYESNLPNSNNPYTYLRSPLAKARRDMFNTSGCADFSDATSEDILLTIFLMYFSNYAIRDLHKSAYDVTTLFPEPEKTAKECIRRGFAVVPTAEETLMHQTVSQLKDYALSQGFIVPNGKKANVVNTVLNNSDPDTLQSYIEENTYVKPSEHGYAMLRSVYNERVETELKIAYELLGRAPDLAIQIAREYSTKRPSLCPSINPIVAQLSKANTITSALMDAKGLLCQSIVMTFQYIEYYKKHPEVKREPSSALYPFPDIEDIKLLPADIEE